MTGGAVVYHFTDTARLPWILATGELKVVANRVGGYPEPRFLWATTDNRGDRSAAAGRDGYRDGHRQLVRFTLAREDFEPWPAVTTQFPNWTPEQIERLEARGRRLGSQPSCWRCRADPLPADRWLLVETKAYTSAWRPRWRAETW
jgi:hypothetical protein